MWPFCSYSLYFSIFKHPYPTSNGTKDYNDELHGIPHCASFPSDRILLNRTGLVPAWSSCLPVFIGGGSGIGYLIAPYGAYTWAFPIVLVVLPLIRGKKYNRIWYTVCAIIGVLIIDFVGMFYLKAIMSYDLKTAFLTGFVPFIPLDLLKAVVVAQIIPAFRKVVE